MTDLPHMPSREDTGHIHSAPPTDGTTPPVPSPNVLTGVVSAHTEGLTRTTYRIRIGTRTDLRLRWIRSAQCRRTLEVGQTVRLTIPQEAVQLEAGGFRRGKQRWNRWIGRVVLTSRHSKTGSTTVKIYQDPITLKSSGPIIDAQTPLTTWDTVNIVVDPERITVCSCARATRPEPPTRQKPRIAAGSLSSAWLRGIVRSVRSIPLGYHLTLRTGGVTLSVLIEIGVTPAVSWKIGHSLEINIGSSDAWVRHDPQGPTLPCCVVLSTDFNEAPPIGFAPQRDRSRTVS